ncbi:hypothetical protein HY570_02675 [Candidatus Micrarchaeota archaeon]|nr:hypothetical protein [Candidatus Micrarchaeota archaeon]
MVEASEVEQVHIGIQLIRGPAGESAIRQKPLNKDSTAQPTIGIYSVAVAAGMPVLGSKVLRIGLNDKGTGLLDVTLTPEQSAKLNVLLGNVLSQGFTVRNVPTVGGNAVQVSDQNSKKILDFLQRECPKVYQEIQTSLQQQGKQQTPIKH